MTTVQQLLKQLTLEEKAQLVCGKTFWDTHDVKRLDIPSMMLTDGPHGLRKQAESGDHLGINESVVSVCFPAGCASASSWDKSLMKQMGQMLGKIAKQENVQVLLGPAMNIKRSPLCGRNFEYLSEDPLLAGELASAYVEGVQSQHVGTSPKHFALNNQEYYRMSNSSNATQKTMREIYLRGFEKVVRTAHPYTMMAAYNKVNGVYACDSHELLRDILRDEWGFDGVVVSDWMASNDRVSNLVAGLDLSMPSTNGASEKAIVTAVQEGRLDEVVLDEAVVNVLTLIERTKENKGNTVSLDEAHAFAKEVADNSAVLLQNNGILPLNPTQKVAFVGPFAKQPRYQGGGSSHIHAYNVVSAMEAAKERGIDVTYIEGYTLDESGDQEERNMDVLHQTSGMDAVVLFVGLPDAYESEGYDRTHLELPKNQQSLLFTLLALNPNVIVVLHNGSAVHLRRHERAAAVLEMYLSGEAVGETTVDVLFGKVNPSGRLAETFPYAIEDTPAYGHFANDRKNTDYQEGVFVGYRHYVTNEVEAQYDFGYGLSYTTFEYSDMTTKVEKDVVTVQVTVNNTGAYDGKEVVQLYVQKPLTAKHPVRELVAFDKVFIPKGESVRVTVTVPKEDLAVWNTYQGGWDVPTGDYVFEIAKNTREVLLTETVTVRTVPTFDLNTTFTDIAEHPAAKAVMDAFMAQKAGSLLASSDEDGVINDQMLEAFMAALPLHALLSMMPDVKEEELVDVVERMNIAVRE